MGIFVLFQYHETGIWLVYFKKQSEHWGHAFSWPSTPFSNIENGIWRYHWLSALAMFMDALAFLFLIKEFVSWLRGRFQRDNILIVCAGYLTMVIITLLFLNPKYGGPTTNIMGANRYTFIAPFFFVFLHYLFSQKYTLYQVLSIFLFANLFWTLFGAWTSSDKFIAISLTNNMLILAFVFFTKNKKEFWLIMAIIAFDFLIQMQFFQEFIRPLYMD